MATTRTRAKSAPGKRKESTVVAAAAKTRSAGSKAGAAKTEPPKKAVPRAKAAAPRPAASSAKKLTGVAPEQRRNYVEMAAYYIAERRGFTPGNPLEDWIQAEAEIDRLLAEGRLGGQN